jgi:hypothetical protein
VKPVKDTYGDTAKVQAECCQVTLVVCDAYGRERPARASLVLSPAKALELAKQLKRAARAAEA